ncbi:lipopolysaccharide-induced tumor necrosis factor-alpha factor homolog [Megalops cyprinoides]|uniref:lipopolysaccharide-induced tumor necrosis factor-alpha factor homolog n=1 Tax=Megalops cyprinoides TaxID=118141 RepID=UPI0018647D2B|nr:lipopolysaccharide-induced tumor necrosis factor-alpha factor homolog [Megalops cyprinoides]
MTTESSGDKTAPPPYIIPVEGQSDDVKVYHVHTPFNPPPSTIQENAYQLQTSSSTQAGPPPKQKFVSYETELGRHPGMTTCTSCQVQVMTNVTYKVGAYAWLMCFLFILCGLVIGCCLIPFFVKHFKDAYHSCPRCNQILHVEKKRCCS